MWSALGLKTLNAAHHWLLRLTGGRVGWRAGGMPVVDLKTIGRKTGQLRSVMLTSPVQEGETWVIVAGADHDPGWLLNLRERPDVDVMVDRLALAADAAIVIDAEIAAHAD